MYENPEFLRSFIEDRNQSLRDVADRQRYLGRDHGLFTRLMCALGRGLMTLGTALLTHYDETPAGTEPTIRRQRAR